MEHLVGPAVCEYARTEQGDYGAEPARSICSDRHAENHDRDQRVINMALAALQALPHRIGSLEFGIHQAAFK
jgi:hypothetical protein